MSLSALVDQVLVASMRHSPRGLQRVVTSITGSGFSIEDVQYRRVGNQNAILVATVENNMASRDFDHLCKLVDRTIDVFWARPVASLVSSEHSRPEEFRIDGYEVASRHADGRTMCEAHAAVVADDRRFLGAGEGVNGCEALTRAVEAAVRLASSQELLALGISCRWSNPYHGTPALVIVESQNSRQEIGSAMGVGLDELDATAKALETLCQMGSLHPCHLP